MNFKHKRRLMSLFIKVIYFHKIPFVTVSLEKFILLLLFYLSSRFIERVGKEYPLLVIILQQEICTKICNLYLALMTLEYFRIIIMFLHILFKKKYHLQILLIL